jgi:hypothetical protein
VTFERPISDEPVACLGQLKQFRHPAGGPGWAR